jgi:hypothetical protein
VPTYRAYWRLLKTIADDPRYDKDERILREADGEDLRIRSSVQPRACSAASISLTRVSASLSGLHAQYGKRGAVDVWP